MIPFWIDNPSILMKRDQLFFWPIAGMTSNEKLNSISRIVVLLTLAGFILTSSANFLWMGVITLSCLVAYYKFNIPEKEPFTQKLENHTVPTSKNPFMNVLLPEINGNPNRKPGLLAYTPKNYNEINNKVKERMPPETYKGTKNELDLQYSMRQFYTTASTTIPNDQEGFGDFLYGNMPSAKEGNKFQLYKNNSRLGPIYGN